jgi:hypothetical protein
MFKLMFYLLPVVFNHSTTRHNFLQAITNAAIPAPHTANAMSTTHFGAASTLLKRNGSKFHVVM